MVKSAEEATNGDISMDVNATLQTKMARCEILREEECSFGGDRRHGGDRLPGITGSHNHQIL